MIIGIDEVGRGPLAGPVVVAAVALPRHFKIQNVKIKIKDSKQLTPKQRSAVSGWIKSRRDIHYAVARVQPKIIDRINVSRAANRAAYRSFIQLKSRIKNLELRDKKLRIMLDGGLHLPKHIPHTTIIRGDEHYPAIALASIIAKVTRDQYMKRQHRAYPHYGFDRHKGYGTAAHIKALRRHGPCPLHRLTFIKNFVTFKK